MSELHEKNIKIAYIHEMAFPSVEANTFDAVWSAAALSEKADTTFFMSRLTTSKTALRKYYDIPASPLHLQSMYLNFYFDYLPNRIGSRLGNHYAQVLDLYLRSHPQWAGFRGQKLLYVREPNGLLFWGLQKKRQAWLKDWTLFYEAHDPLGMDPSQFQGSNPFALKDGPEGKRRQTILQAALQFDAVICNTQVLANDINSWTDGSVKTQFITLASPLPRLAAPRQIHSFGEKVTLGYIGTIDQYRGVNILLEAMRFLPERFALRIVGRLRQETGVDAGWLQRYMQDPQIGPKVDLNIVDSIEDVAAEIERCDIVIQPASNDILDSRYAAPLKSYGYMVRGKPIIAGDVPCHRELFRDGKTALLYRLDPQSFANAVISLVNDPALAERVACAAWKQSAIYNLPRRADDIIALAKERLVAK